ncbi:MAG: aminoglycoside phosphotransferase family protein [Sedimenticola sp.]
MTEVAELATIVARLAEVEDVTLIPLGRGGNSSVYRVMLPSGVELALKHYPPPEASRPDRLQAEVGGLRFLAEQGVECVPRPLVCSAEERIALFSWIEGAPPAALGRQEFDAACDFLARLHTLRESVDAQWLPLAAEACFSGAELERQLAMRMEQLLQVDGAPGLTAFLEQTYQPAWKQMGARARLRYQQQGLSFAEELTSEYLTLSPSDFGFHNAIQGSDGALSFVDFEYFGWDDPVKLVADFLWHPAMSISEPTKKAFVGRTKSIYRHDPSFEARLAALYPLFGLRWCMILLNEFLHQGQVRRAHANATGEDEWTEIKQRQLKRAHRLLDEILRTYERFPY